jgi:hypothetical protein
MLSFDIRPSSSLSAVCEVSDESYQEKALNLFHGKTFTTSDQGQDKLAHIHVYILPLARKWR